MHDIKFVKVLYASDDLMKYFAGLSLRNLLRLDDVVEQLSALHILHN